MALFILTGAGLEPLGRLRAEHQSAGFALPEQSNVVLGHVEIRISRRYRCRGGPEAVASLVAAVGTGFPVDPAPPPLRWLMTRALCAG